MFGTRGPASSVEVWPRVPRFSTSGELVEGKVNEDSVGMLKEDAAPLSSLGVFSS